MITLKIFDTAIEAHILKSRLQNEGIPAYVFDEHIVTLNPLYNNLVGGVKLKISILDADRAQKVLEEIESTDIYNEHGTRIVCPRCGSGNFYTGFKSLKNVSGLFAFLLSVVFVVYPFHYKSVKKCKGCNFEFN